MVGDIFLNDEVNWTVVLHSIATFPTFLIIIPIPNILLIIRQINYFSLI